MVRHEVQAELVPPVPNADQPTDLRVTSVQPALRLHAEQAAADPGRGRADLPPPALLPDRHGGQVRGHALDRRGRRVLRPGAAARQGRVLRPVRCRTQGLPLPVARLLPPDLVIQDELHLISGRWARWSASTRSALDELVLPDGRRQEGPAEDRRLDGDRPPGREPDPGAVRSPRRWTSSRRPGPDRRDSFFAETHPRDQSHPRLYLGVAAQGRSPKVVMLRVYLALLGAAQKRYLADGGEEEPGQPGRPVHDAARLLQQPARAGRSRRIIEDEVSNRLVGYGSRKRVGETEGLFADRKIAYEVVELTSRVSTDKVAEAKRRLARPFSETEHVDVAIATNMISVGLDITRLGLMVVLGQPKTMPSTSRRPAASAATTSGPGWW